MLVSKYKKKLLVLYFIILGTAFLWQLLSNYFNPFLFKSRINELSIVISIDKGSNAREIAKQLYEDNVISSSFWFLNYIFFKGWDKALKFGEYEILRGETPVEIAQKIYEANVIEHRMTILEGWKFSDLRKYLNSLANIEHTIKGKSNQQIAEILNIPEAFLDGAFLPNTYYYSSGENDIKLLRKAYQTMQTVFKREFEKHQKNKYNGFITWTNTVKDKYKVLSLAAIIEKEVLIEKEYRIVSSVFHNRLSKNMLLQADPTVIYAIGEQYKGRILTRHLRFKSPYNTYTTKGLPPFPIAYASPKAIYAALNPASTDYIYFVAKGNGREHIFNTTLKEHSKAVDRYWKIIESRKKK